jgi:hypothetical protein
MLQFNIARQQHMRRQRTHNVYRRECAHNARIFWECRHRKGRFARARFASLRKQRVLAEDDELHAEYCIALRAWECVQSSVESRQYILDLWTYSTLPTRPPTYKHISRLIYHQVLLLHAPHILFRHIHLQYTCTNRHTTCIPPFFLVHTKGQNMAQFVYQWYSKCM